VTEKTVNERHQHRMQRKKTVVDSAIEAAQDERGVIIILTGNGKGKSSSAFGMAARALGHGMKVGIVQFIKGSFSTGEEPFFKQFEDVSYSVMGEGFTWETQDRARDVKTAEIAWEKAVDLMSNEDYDMIVLDELNIVLKYGYLKTEAVIEALENKPFMQHVIITGRGANQTLIDMADTVTEMREVKHAFKAGVKAQKGIEL